MAQEVILNLTNVVNSLPPTWISWLKGGLVLLGAISLLFVINLIYLITATVLNIKRARRLKRVEEKLDKIYNKLFRKNN